MADEKEEVENLAVQPEVTPDIYTHSDTAAGKNETTIELATTTTPREYDTKERNATSASQRSLIHKQRPLFLSNCDADDDEGVFHGLKACYPLSTYIKDYKQIIKELICGVIVAFAQVPESIAFALLAEVPPIIGLHSAWYINTL